MIALNGMISSSTRHHTAMIACKSKAGRLDVNDDSTMTVQYRTAVRLVHNRERTTPGQTPSKKRSIRLAPG
jgi:hypothetical protein